MKLKPSISGFLRYIFVAICFIAISLNVFSFHGNSNLAKTDSLKKEHKQDQQGDKEEYKFCTYEAVVVPTAHFNAIYHFCFSFNVGILQTAVEVIKQSPPLFTRPYYRTLFRMIISPNAP